MTPIDDRITEAWRSGRPAALHRAAEGLAAQGYEETAIYEALERLLLAERAAGADDEAEDRITDVMERLVGWCHESNHIKTNRGGPATGNGSTRPGTDAPAEGPRWSVPE